MSHSPLVPKVSVIIPTYNASRFLHRTIKSVLNQTFHNFELIIVDDCSQDNTQEIIDFFKNEDKRTKSIFLEKNSGGPAFPKNIGLSIAQGNYIAYLDHDDEWLPQKLERQLELVESLEDINSFGVISSNAYIEYETTHLLESGLVHREVAKPFWGGNKNIVNIDERTPSFKKVLYKSLKDVFIHPELYASNNSGMFFSKKILDILGLRNEEVGEFEDTDIVFRIAEAGLQFYLVDEPLFVVHKHTNNLTKSYGSFNSKQALQRANRFSHLLGAHPFYKELGSFYGGKLRGVGMLYLLGDSPILARKYFMEALRINFLDLKSLASLLLSIFGAGFYRHFFIIRELLGGIVKK
ncbi:MAG: glycosyltransferase [Candidatus Paceibacterota bacterium]|jgi:glycosyltransferase involved in cell wall biosynthesis